MPKKTCFILTQLKVREYPYKHLNMCDIVSNIFEFIKSHLGLQQTHCFNFWEKYSIPEILFLARALLIFGNSIFFRKGTHIHLWKWYFFHFQNFFQGKTIMEIFKKWLCQKSNLWLFPELVCYGMKLSLPLYSLMMCVFHKLHTWS